MTLPISKIILSVLSLALCAAAFAWGTWYVVGMFSETSYKVTATFLSLILLSNISAKICTHTIQHYGKSI